MRLLWCVPSLPSSTQLSLKLIQRLWSDLWSSQSLLCFLYKLLMMAANCAQHRLQRLSSPSRSVSALIHLVGILSFSASFRYLTLYPTPISQNYGGSFQFLTIIGLASALTTFSVGLLADLTLNPTLFRIKNRLSVCSAPLEVLVSILYWGLIAIDPTLVVPPEFALPFLPDFGFHAMPAIMLAIDLLLLSPPWTIRAYPAMALSMTIAFLYWAWVEYCYGKNGMYVTRQVAR